LLCLAAWGLRLGPLWVNRFHADEALYATWAQRIATWHDPLLVGVMPDKPPLFFYLTAGMLAVLGHTEVAARLINLSASVIAVALTSVLWPDGSGVAATVMALSPLAIAFAPTAFLDPLMVTLILAALVAVTRGRWGWGGLWLGLAAATKVQAFLLLPLVAALGGVCGRRSWRVVRQTPCVKRPWSFALGQFFVGLVIPCALVLLWDRWRGGAPFWVVQTAHYGGLGLIRAEELLPRLAGWASLLPYLFGWPLLAAMPALIWHEHTRSGCWRAAASELALLAFALAYLLLHWLLTFQVWDRYLLGLVPVGALWLGRLAGRSIQFRLKFEMGILVVVAGLLLPFALQASRSELPIGGDHGAHDGIDQVAEFLRPLPQGAVVYDHWTSWELRYYLFGAPAYVSYFPTPAWLAEDLHVFGRTSPRYVLFPAGESTTHIERALAAENFGLTLALTTTNRAGQPTFALYRIDTCDIP